MLMRDRASCLQKSERKNWQTCLSEVHGELICSDATRLGLSQGIAVRHSTNKMMHTQACTPGLGAERRRRAGVRGALENCPQPSRAA